MTMILSDIRRRKAGVLEFDEGAVALGEKASELLGYSALRDREQKDDGAGSLARQILALGIDILDEADVARYMAEKLIEVGRAAIERFERDLPGNGNFGAGRAPSLILPSWVEREIKDYKQPVPLRVLDKLVRIKEAVPGVVVKIIALEQHPDPFAVVGLPHKEWNWMLDEAVWVDAWDEPGFGEASK